MTISLETAKAVSFRRTIAKANPLRRAGSVETRSAPASRNIVVKTSAAQAEGTAGAEAAEKEAAEKDARKHADYAVSV